MYAKWLKTIYLTIADVIWHVKIYNSLTICAKMCCLESTVVMATYYTHYRKGTWPFFKHFPKLSTRERVLANVREFPCDSLWDLLA